MGEINPHRDIEEQEKPEELEGIFDKFNII